MLTPTTVVLKLPLDDRAALAPSVETCLASGISLIAVWGEGVGGGSDAGRFLSTSAYGPEEDAPSFAMDWDNGGTALVVRL